MVCKRILISEPKQRLCTQLKIESKPHMNIPGGGVLHSLRFFQLLNKRAYPLDFFLLDMVVPTYLYFVRILLVWLIFMGSRTLATNLAKMSASTRCVSLRRISRHLELRGGIMLELDELVYRLTAKSPLAPVLCSLK